MRRPKKMFKSNPDLLNCCHTITLANHQPKLACPVNNHIRDVQGLELGIRCSGDVGQIKNFYDDGKYGRNWVPRMVCCLLDDVLALYKFVGHQLTLVLLEASEHVRHNVVTRVCHAVSDIRKILFLDCGKFVFEK